MRSLRCSVLIAAFAALLCAVPLRAQEQPVAPVAPNVEQQGQVQSVEPAHMNAAAEKQTEVSHGASSKHEEEEGEYDKFKYSAMVQKLAGMTGLSVKGAYWLSMALNFLLIAVLVFALLKAKLPSYFSTRKETIQRGIKDAQAASEDARRRLGEVETRLARLDADIAELRTASEKDAVAEEDRIRRAAEEDAKKVLQTAEQEIETASRQARRELKALAAELAVGLAEKKLQIDPATDRVLVGEFVQQLGKDGK